MVVTTIFCRSVGEEFDYELKKHLEKEIPNLFIPIKPSLDEIVCGFL